jgi:superfamily II DNA/RNA helicase
MAFANTKRRCEHLANSLWQAGYASFAIHGDKTQKEREESLAKFRCVVHFAFLLFP